MKKKSERIDRKNNFFIISGVCGLVIVTLVISALAINNSQNTIKKPSSEQIRDTDAVAVPENLIVFNKCRILKMVDDYNEIKTDRSKRENFKIYYVIDDKTIPCLEERSRDTISFVNNINDDWSIRKDETFLSNNSTQTPEYFLERYNNMCKNNLTISEDRDIDLKNFALYYAYWGTLGNFGTDIDHFMTYEFARDLVFEAGATYISNDNGFILSITLPSSGQKIIVTQDTDKDSGVTPIDYGRWYRGWWEGKSWL